MQTNRKCFARSNLERIDNGKGSSLRNRVVISRGKGIVYRLSNIISLPEFIIYTSDPLRKNNRRNFLREKLQTVFRRKKESSRKFLADECETACTRFDAWKEAGYTRTNVQLYTNPRKRRYREREREEGKGRGIRKEATSEPAVTVISAPTAKPPLEFTSIYD